MNKKISNQIITTLTGSSVSILLGLLSVILSARFLGADGRGELAVLMTIPLMAASFVGFGGGYSSVHFTVLEIGTAYRNWKTALKINLWTVPLITACIVIYYLLCASNKSIIADTIILIFIVCSTALYSSTWGIYLGMRDFRAYNIKKTIPQVLYLLSIISAVLHHNAVYVAMIYCFMLLIYSGFEFLAGTKLVDEASGQQKKSDLSFFKYGLHSFLPTIPQAISQKIDLLFAISVFDHRFVGLYAVSASIGQLFQGLNASLGNILLAKDKGPSGKISYVFFWSFVKLVSIANITLLILFYFLGDFAIGVFLGQDFLEIKSIALLLIMSGALYGVNCIIYDGFRASSLQSIPVISEVLSLILKVFVLAYFAVDHVVTMNHLAIAVLASATMSFLYCVINLVKIQAHEKIS